MDRELDSFKNVLSEINTMFIPDATYPKFEKLLEKIFMEDQTILLQEWFGYCIAKWMVPNRFLFIVDPKDIMGPILKILSNMIDGDHNSRYLKDAKVQHIRLRDLSGHRYLKYLENRFLNITHYIGSMSHNDISNINLLTDDWTHYDSGSPGRTCHFKNTAKIMLVDNYFPRLPKNRKILSLENQAGYDFWNRLILFTVDKNGIDYEDYQDIRTLCEDINSTELSGILNWSLTGLDRLTKKGFSYDVTPLMKMEKVQ